MWMSTCLLYTSCKYFWNLVKIVHFRAKHRISKLCKQTPLNKQKDSMCNKANTHKILQGYRRFHFMFHAHELVYVLSVEFIPYKLFNMLHIFFWMFFRMFEKTRDYTLKKGTWLVAWSWSVRMPHQRTYMWRWILSAIARSKSIRFLIP